MAYENRLLEQDYFYTHSEPHRRRPTVVHFPQLITHTATYYAPNETQFPRQAFENWLTNTFLTEQPGQWLMRDPNGAGPGSPLDDALIKRFSQIAQRSTAEEDQDRTVGGAKSPPDFDVEFFLELEHVKLPGIVLRLEAHREYFCITLFRPLEANECSLSSCFNLCDELAPQPGKLNSHNPLHKVYKAVADTFANATFANFQGVVLGSSSFEDGPFFPPYRGREPTDVELAKTVQFLKRCKEDFGNGVLEANRHDAVACYFQHYQALYVSGLGGQATKDSKNPLRYVVIHSEPTFDQSGYDGATDRHRLSRLVNRLNSIGTLRLAALRDLRLLRRAGERLRRIEMLLGSAGVHPKQKTRRDELTTIMYELDNIARASSDAGVPIFYRTARAKYYFAQMQRLLIDMDVGHIPSWQNYEQFLRRRLYSSFEFAAGLGQRILDLWEIARSRAEVAEAHALSWLKSAANAASVILLPLAAADMLRDRTPFAALWDWLSTIAVSYLPISGLIVGFSHVVPEWLTNWWSRADVREFVITYVLALTVWLVIVAPLGKQAAAQRYE
ncbi:MAG: DUF3422 family protein [Hyphomonadaceae bacterium]